MPTPAQRACECDALSRAGPVGGADPADLVRDPRYEVLAFGSPEGRVEHLYATAEVKCRRCGLIWIVDRSDDYDMPVFRWRWSDRNPPHHP